MMSIIMSPLLQHYQKMKSDNKTDEIHQRIIGNSEIMMCVKCRIANIARFP